MRRGAAADVTFGRDDPNRRRQVREYIAEHAEFEKLVLDAETEALEHVEDALYQAATSGNVPAARAWIELTRGPPAEREDQQPDRPAGADDPFGDLTVVPLDPRERKRQREQGKD
jgi:hypothetical protein